MKNLAEKWIFIAIGVVSLFIVGIAVISTSNSQKPEQVASNDLLKKDSQVLGSQDAKVTIVEFADFQCPACGTVHSIVKQVTKEYGDKILFAYRHFPIISSHQYALKAAEASEAAGEQGKFWDYYDILYDNQENLKTEDLIRYAKRLNLDMDKFKHTLDSGKYKDKITADMDAGDKFGVGATPTFFINGTKYQGVLSFDKFKSIIDEQLAK